MGQRAGDGGLLGKQWKQWAPGSSRQRYSAHESWNRLSFCIKYSSGFGLGAGSREGRGRSWSFACGNPQGPGGIVPLPSLSMSYPDDCVPSIR